MNILTSHTKAFITPKATAVAAAKAPESNDDVSLFDSVTTGMTENIGLTARPLTLLAGASAGVSAGLGLANLAKHVLPVEAAIPGLVLAGVVGLGAAAVGGKVGWDAGPGLVDSALRQSENFAAKLHLPKSTGKLVASAAWLGTLSSGIGAGGAVGVMSAVTAAATTLSFGLGAATGAIRHHKAQQAKTEQP